MIGITPFVAADLDALVLQDAQRREIVALGAVGAGPRLEAAGPAFTARDAGGRVIACAGLIEVHAGHATAWARLAADKGHDFVAFTRATRRVLDASSYRRIDTPVMADFLAGCRWAQLLGMGLEARLRAYGAGGEDVLVYARVKG
ncbi:hypothetical protein FHS96_004987 [Sphingomonas zeicaulis]|uniref:hypothetical protein n=1 Tax=Sphingomonas zeicaulis TaxID=1632740 RepID=UPI003D20561C